MTRWGFADDTPAGWEAMLGPTIRGMQPGETRETVQRGIRFRLVMEPGFMGSVARLLVYNLGKADDGNLG